MNPKEEKEQAMLYNPIHGACNCGYKLEVDPAWVGHKFTCLKCHTKIGVTKYGLIKALR